MLVYLLFCALLIWIFYKFTRGMEIKSYGNWEAFTLPLWLWIIIVLVALVPIINIGVLLAFIGSCVADSRATSPDTRFKEGNVIYNIVDKIISLLNKEF